jgi:chromosomal replication initiation ATPase DnaA
MRWLREWDAKNLKASEKGSGGAKTFKICMLSGAPGLGKTTLAHVACRYTQPLNPKPLNPALAHVACRYT